MRDGDILPTELMARRENLERLGGAEWVRGKIDRAKEPNAGVTGAELAKRPR